MNASDLQRWSRDVAEDPGAPAFLPLARAYRRQGRRDAALSVVLRGLERNPEHVEAHALLALLYVDAGERQRAGDEWQTILRLDPDNFDARRGLGFLALEKGDLARARAHLQAAADARPGDPTISQALGVLARREAGRREPVGADVPARAEPADGDEIARGRDPTRLFAPLDGESPFVGAVILDRRGLVLAGAMSGRGGMDGEALGALLSPAVTEARRTVELLGLGTWEGLLLESEGAILHVAPLDECVLVVAARLGSPAGWVVRTARRARDLARRFLESSA